MSLGLTEKHLRERIAQPVGLALQQGLDELPSLGLAEVHHEIAKIAL